MQTQAPDKIGTTPPPPYANSDIKTLSSPAAKALEFGNTRLEMVFAIDNKGNTQVFRHSESKAIIPLGFSLKPNQAVNTNMAKTMDTQDTCPAGFVECCWIDEDGFKICICIPSLV